eukprot:CAMPEP_0113866748 /NCGR_PEP_ID=MMETSP0780_2-20120614/40_1 /TAXON_ID=652834 /ORGANISM="Palpitomonas bilix" /LENGTH=157 /DNA_ID=CAMNT_0000851623 /DNA_START=158 /DNA_END=628 /DNA_ORIENTATION=+ /assembly_acc=CAM_ASM_000599
MALLSRGSHVSSSASWSFTSVGVKLGGLLDHCAAGAAKDLEELHARVVDNAVLLCDSNAHLPVKNATEAAANAPYNGVHGTVVAKEAAAGDLLGIHAEEHTWDEVANEAVLAVTAASAEAGLPVVSSSRGGHRPINLYQHRQERKRVQSGEVDESVA